MTEEVTVLTLSLGPAPQEPPILRRSSLLEKTKNKNDQPCEFPGLKGKQEEKVAMAPTGKGPSGHLL